MAQCKKAVYVRDTYRYCGGRSHFKMHYSRQQCKRKAKPNGYCWQHQAYAEEVGLVKGGQG